jgi:mRNA interferase MazF
VSARLVLSARPSLLTVMTCAEMVPAVTSPAMDKPPYVKPTILAAPKIRNVYWCDFWKDALLPEMWKKRPVLVVSYKNRLNGPCTVLAISTDPQEGQSAVWAYPLPIEVEPGRKSWVVCNHLYTVSPSRLSQVRGGVPRLDETHFNAILAKLYEWLPRLPEVVEPAVVEPATQILVESKEVVIHTDDTRGAP